MAEEAKLDPPSFRQRRAEELEAEPHEIIVPGLAVVFVINSLGKELLPAADLIRVMLRNRFKEWEAMEAIARMGREGLEFYADLLGKLKEEATDYHLARALGAILRAAPEKAPEMMALAEGEDRQARINATMALGYYGRADTELSLEMERRLRARLQTGMEGGERHEVVWALGEVAQEEETVSLLLGLLDPSQPENAGPVILALVFKRRV